MHSKELKDMYTYMCEAYFSENEDYAEAKKLFKKCLIDVDMITTFYKNRVSFNNMDAEFTVQIDRPHQVSAYVRFSFDGYNMRIFKITDMDEIKEFMDFILDKSYSAYTKWNDNVHSLQLELD